MVHGTVNLAPTHNENSSEVLSRHQHGASKQTTWEENVFQKFSVYIWIMATGSYLTHGWESDKMQLLGRLHSVQDCVDVYKLV